MSRRLGVPNVLQPPGFDPFADVPAAATSRLVSTPLRTFQRLPPLLEIYHALRSTRKECLGRHMSECEAEIAKAVIAVPSLSQVPLELPALPLHELFERQALHPEVAADVRDFRPVGLELLHGDNGSSLRRRLSNHERVGIAPALKELPLLD